MAAHVRNMRQGTLVVADGGGHSLTIPCRDGDLKFTIKREAPVVKNRGALYSFASPQEEAVEISFTVIFEEFEGMASSPNTASPADALLQLGNASAWVSTLSNAPFCVDLTFTIAKPENPSGTVEQEVLTFADFHADSVEFSEGADVNKLAVSGKALITAPASVKS